MAKGQLRSSKEARKPKKEKPATPLATRSATASALAAHPAPGLPVHVAEKTKH